MPSYILQRFKTLRTPLSLNGVNIRQVAYPQPLQYAQINTVDQSTTTRKYKAWLTWKSTLKSFAPIGICLIAVMQWRSYRKRMRDRTANTFEINCYCILPLRMVSRWWGWLADKNLPEFLRPLIYGTYINTFGVNLSEAITDDLTTYKSLSEFFARPLKEGARVIDHSSPIVAPCDGTVLHFGTINTGNVEQVKGVTYSLENFLGENTWNKDGNQKHDYRSSLLHKMERNHTLYQCVIYLAPGDYHRFHSPVEWSPRHRRHFHGKLLSVNPSIAQWLPGLFCINERAVYLGEWEHGFFSYAAVGATNVGTIRVYFDKTLQTNRPKTHYQKDKCIGSSVILKKGDPVGEFRMGSTIVLVFEAPNNFNFNLKNGQKVKMGEGIGRIGQEPFVKKSCTNDKINAKNALSM